MIQTALPTRMLMLKAWYESRIRLLLVVTVTAGLCCVFLVFHGRLHSHMRDATPVDASYNGYVYLRIYGGYVRGLFLFFAIVLGLGGLQRERAHGSIGFTLALPVARLQLLSARALVGLVQVAIVSWLPVLLVPSLSAVVGEHYAVAQSAEFALLWTVVGAAVFSASFLASAVISNEYAALTAVLFAFYVYPLVVVKTPILQGRPIHIHYVMNGTGMSYFNPATDLLTGPIPWHIIGGFGVATVLFLSIGALATMRADFS
ncbi:MAG: ABC transporter permease subunit [Gemmatimonadales bacterium]